MNQVRVIELIESHINNELTQEQRIELSLWLEESEENRRLFNRITDERYVKESISYLESIDSKQEWQKSLKFKKQRRRKNRIGLAFSTATVLALLSLNIYLSTRESGSDTVSINSLVSKNEFLNQDSILNKITIVLSDGKKVGISNLHSEEYYTADGLAICVRNGKVTYSLKKEYSSSNKFVEIITSGQVNCEIQLNDGSQVWLNAYSSLKFPVEFAQHSRNVELQGEAFFEVNHQLHKTFLVRYAQQNIEVLGTSFNINAYQDWAKTTLVEGQIKYNSSMGSVLLSPGEQIISNERSYDKQNADIERVLAWRKGDFKFENADVYEILQELSHWYGFSIGGIHSKYRGTYSGVISRNLTLNEMLKIINQMTGESFFVIGKYVTNKNNI